MLCSVQKFPDDLHSGFLLLFIYGFCLYPLQCTLTTFSLVSSSYLSMVFASTRCNVHWRPSCWFLPLIYPRFLPPTRCSTLTTFSLVSSSYLSMFFASTRCNVHWRPSRWFLPLIYLRCLPLPAAMYIDDQRAGFLLFFIYGFLPLPAAMYIDDLPAGFLLLFIYGFLPHTRCSTMTTFPLVSFSFLSMVFAPLPAVVAGGPSSPASGAPAPTQDLRLRHETSVPGEPQRSLRTPQGDQRGRQRNVAEKVR